MDVDTATDTATHYMETLTVAGFLTLLPDTQPNEWECNCEQYTRLLHGLHSLAFEKYPKALSENNLDAHLTNISRFVLDYFTQNKVIPSPDQTKEETISPQLHVPVGGNTTNQLPPRRYILVSVSVDSVPVEGQLVIWHISVHIPSLPDNEDPDYECLMLPELLREKRIWRDLGFTYDTTRNMFYHQGTEFGRRWADPEEVSLEKFINYLDEIRSGLHGAGPNNGLVLLFETGEDMALVQQLLNRHRHHIFLDTVKGVTCLDHYLRATQSGQTVVTDWPVFRYRLGEAGFWTASVSRAGSPASRIKAETKPECIYNICENLLGAPPDFNNFIKWYSYPVNHSEIILMSSSLERIYELLPLQDHIFQKLFTNRVPIVLEGIYAARSEVETAWPHKACARQTIRQLVSLGFTLDVLMKLFRVDPQYDIPSIVFLQHMTEVQKLRVHRQTEQIRGIIKQYFVMYYSVSNV